MTNMDDDKVVTQKEEGRPQRSRQWIYDRVDGVSKQEGDRPPSFLCFPSPFLKCCPFLLEENCFCTTLGRIGCFAQDTNNNNGVRKAILEIGLFFNIIGLLSTCLAALAYSEYIPLLQLTSWNSAELNVASRLSKTLSFPPPSGGDEGGRVLSPVGSSQQLDPITIHVGLRAVAMNNPNTFGEQLVPFDQFCDLVNEGMEKYINPDDCDQCNQVSMQLSILILVAIIAFIPTMMTDILRRYSNYDVNCQKVLGNIFSLCTIAGFVLSYHRFNESCMEIFHDGLVRFTQDGTIVSPTSTILVDASNVIMDFDWRVGNGMIFLFCAFGCKIINLLCSSCIQTPIITRSIQEQKEYDGLLDDYEGSVSESESSIDEYDYCVGKASC